MCRSPGTRPSARSGRQLKGFDPRQVVLYASGRASLETVLHVGAVRAALRHEQPARQLEHVPREHLGRSAGKHRRAGRHGDAGRFREDATASCSSARMSAPTARACCILCRRPRSAACRSSPSIRCKNAAWSAFTNPQSPTEMLTGSETSISVAISPGEDRRRHRGDHGHWQDADRGRRPGSGGGQERLSSITTSSPSTHTASRPLRKPPRAGAMARDSERRSGLTPRHAGSGREHLCARECGDGHLRHGPHPAQGRRRERADARQPAAAARKYRQAGSRHLPGARPFQCPGPAHGRHLREAGARAARQARRSNTASSRRAGKA